MVRSAPRGSSPLTRGKHYQSRAWCPPARLIPAHAGKTGSEVVGHFRCPAHPRSRGENGAPLGVLRAFRGSSPLTRGKQDAAARAVCWRRLIPAHAGKTPTKAGRGTSSRAHPRSRGENARITHREHDGGGSSPLTRGKLLERIRSIVHSRLIPAHAGKTAVANSRRLRIPAHPRSRGENCRGGRVVAGLDGSSPLTRGKRLSGASIHVTARLIPAHAGKTTPTR